MGTFQKLALLVLSSQATLIPPSELEKKYPTEMQVIKSLDEYLRDAKTTSEPVKLMKVIP